MAPHKSAATVSLLLSIITKWDLGEKLLSVTTDNAAEVCTVVSMLLSRFPLPTGWTIERYNVRCVAHIVNLGVKIVQVRLMALLKAP